MIQSARWITILFVFLTVITFGSIHTFAAPSAVECLENPELEGCPSQETDDNSTETPADVQERAEGETGPSLGWTIVKLIFVLLLVLGLIYGLLKFFNQKNKLFSRNRTMENLGGMNLAPNRSIQAVRIGEQVFILGVGDDVQMVTEVTDDKTKKSLLDREESNIKEAFGVSRLVDRLRSQDKPASSGSTVKFQQLFESQLKEMKQKAVKARQRKKEDQENE